MFIPVGTHTQHIEQIDKDGNGDITRQKIMAVSVSVLPVFYFYAFEPEILS